MNSWRSLLGALATVGVGSLEVLMTGTFHELEWARIGADGVFLLFGAFPLVCAALLSVYQIMFQTQRPRGGV